MADLLESRRCTAKSKRSQERCRRAAVIGGTVCAMHGGKAPQVKAAAEQRDLEAKAEAEVRSLWVGLDKATPVKDPVASLERLAGALEQAADVVGAKVNNLGHLASGTGLTGMRGEVVLLERLLGQLRQVLDAMARLGIAERHVELEQERAQLVTAAFLAALASITLLPADRDLMLRTFLQGLGRGPDVVLEAGAGGAA
jgi:hypothetical protein